MLFHSYLTDVFFFLPDRHKAMEILRFWSKSGATAYLSSWHSRNGRCLLQAGHVFGNEGNYFSIIEIFQQLQHEQ